MAMITEIDDFYDKGCGRCDRFDTADCSTKHWNAGLRDLRRIALGTGLTEVVKWGHPCFMREGRNVALIGAFRDDFRLSFFNAALLRDGDGVLEKSGPNTQHADVIRFTSNEQPGEMEAVLVAYLTEAIGYADAGIKPEKSEVELDYPDELVDALDRDPALAEAWHALTPGRQRSYVINLNGAKQPATRVARIEKFREKIFAGKGALDR
ncbi:MAG: YdeI/OmpD-associated family protein [Baekduia sp.]